MNLFKPRWAFALFVLFAQSANAIIIEYDLTPLGGSSYRYDYTVVNSGSLGSGVSLELFDVLFDPSLYDETSLSIATPAPLANDWDEYFLGSGIALPAAYEAFALAGGIADGATVSGFAVEFTWLGAGLPGRQDFEVYDPNTFDLLAVGSTRSPESAVPLAAPLLLILFGMGLIRVQARAN
ncbi:MAG: hypothetical protein H6955_06410 [Chromatiaceae bacterium]|nr:hypothetical protein [Chromatiaceae bacterium]